MHHKEKLLTAAWLIAIAAGCSSGEDLDKPSTLSCGAGTHPEQGVCVVDDAGMGGTGGAAGGGGAAGVQDGGAGASGGGDAALDVVEEGMPGPGDDPCPSGTIQVNCSDHCGGPTENCQELTCTGALTHSGFLINGESDFPFVMRTPPKPGVDPECKATLCLAGATEWGMFVRMGGQLDPSFVTKVTVGPPWRIQITDANQPNFCLFPSTPEGCDVAGAVWPYLSVQIVTDDPDAPSRNVLIEHVPKPGSCP